ncbi:MAG: acyl-CoA dehydrogenase family protein [Deltaproteobacteria bacterium]|nr:acyl-CoA dehydrogenase family protein [Deltaproteobacteria bacterium]
MDFELSHELQALRQRVRAFVDERIIPVESKIIAEDRSGDETTLRGLMVEAQRAGLWTPHLPAAFGGLGLGVMGMCVLFREMGRSLVGARVFNCDAPDQGNMDLLLAAASEAAKGRWLAPLAAGEITSAFCMTEPAPGAGADPANLRTRAVEEGDGFVINGHKWYSTGAGRAAFLIVMARTSDDARTGATMFLVDRHTPGVRHVRDVPTMGGDLLQHREAELLFENVQVSKDAVIGKVGDGFRLAQKRLVPARLTHCMRWLGLADRTLQLCRAYLSERVSFGRRLAEHQLIQEKIAEGASAIHAGNLMTFHCAWMLEQGNERHARAYSSMTKLHVARLLCRVLDDAIQVHGGLGYSDDVPFAEWYKHARAARIADGPDEVHQMLISREFLTNNLPLLV